MKHCVMIMLAMLLALCAAAQESNSLYIGDFEIEQDSVMTIPLVLSNDTPFRGMQFNITLPNGLKIVESSLNHYSQTLTMNLNSKEFKSGSYVMLIYPMDRVCFPADSVPIMTLSIKAASNFKGGDITIWKAIGVAMDNTSYTIHSDITRVTVPARSLVGVPVDQQSSNDNYFNLPGD